MDPTPEVLLNAHLVDGKEIVTLDVYQREETPYYDVGEGHIDIFDDRLEIYSPDGMYDGSLIQDRDIDNVPSKRRNPVVADIFSRLDFME